MKITKERLQSESNDLKAKINFLEDQIEEFKKADKDIRRELSELLGSFSYPKMLGFSNEDKEINVKSWMGISCLIGELKADANYSILLKTNTGLREEIEKLKNNNKNIC